jgi:hypothetical protein
MSPIVFGFTLVSILVVPAILFFVRDARLQRVGART